MPDMVDIPGAPTIRRPRQQRSRSRYEAVLDSAERLLEDFEPQGISIYTIAEDTGISPASIYHFFADADAVFYALAERYYAIFAKGYDVPPERPPHSWQELWDVRSAGAAAFYNSHAAARKILLGSGLSAAMRARDLILVRELAELGVEDLKTHFDVPNLPGLVDRVTETFVLNDALWTLSVHAHGRITSELEEQARRARTAYARTFLPEYLTPRS